MPKHRAFPVKFKKDLYDYLLGSNLVFLYVAKGGGKH